MSERYVVTTEDIGHPCCHEAMVTDTKNSVDICECWDIDTAKKIADALNALDNIEGTH